MHQVPTAGRTGARGQGAPAELCAKGERLNSTAARVGTKQLCTGCSQGNVCEELKGPVPEGLGQFRKPQDRLPMSQLLASTSV